jgi:hypothetical protein
MYGLGPIAFYEGCAVDSMDRSTEYQVTLLTSEDRHGLNSLREKSQITKRSGAKSRGIPHLAKNKRDVGHPGSFLGARKKGFRG